MASGFCGDMGWFGGRERRSREEAQAEVEVKSSEWIVSSAAQRSEESPGAGWVVSAAHYLAS